MPRPTRKDPDHGWHHVVNRGARRRDIFIDDADRQLFLKLLQEGAARFGVEVVAFCLMGNHYHLILHCPGGGLSDFMHHVATNYVRAFNAYHGYDGPLFRARFMSNDPITSDDQLLTATRYVHRNPLELGFAIEGYRWSSYDSYLGGPRRPPWLIPDVPLHLVGGSGPYRTFVETDLPTDETPMAWGQAAMPDQPRPHRGLTLDQIDTAVANAAGVAVGSLLQSRPGQANVPRMIAIMIAAGNSGRGAGAIAKHYGLGGREGVRSVVRRTHKRLRADPRVQILLDLVHANLTVAQVHVAPPHNLNQVPGTGVQV